MMCRRDKNQYINQICQEIEAHANTIHTRDLFQKVNFLSREFKPQTWVIEDEEGRTLTDIEVVLRRWRNYCAALYEEREYIGSDSTAMEDLEPDILMSEVKDAINKLKSNKSPGSDNIPAEILKRLGTNGLKTLHLTCNDVWRTCIWPSDWVDSNFVPLFKKGSTKKCENYRTVSLISHASKVLLHIINQRLKYYLDSQIPPEQAGFVKGKGTREQIFNIRLLIEKSREFRVPIACCFIDYSKAFDCVRWDSMWMVLTEMGVPPHLTRLVKQLYQNNTATVRVNKLSTENFQVQKGVRQGCILSPLLFNIYGEYIMRKVLDGWEGGLRVGGKSISNLRYADDTTLITTSLDDMRILMNRVEQESELLGLQINRNKTKIMLIDREQFFDESDGLTDVESVQEFVYLGSKLCNDGRCEGEIRRRIAMAKSAMTKLSKIWKDRSITIATKARLVRALVFPIFLYGAETWTIKARDQQRVDAFEMWCWRRMLRIPWTARQTNVSILRRIGVEKRLSATCAERI
jgi:hypothetical protein